MKLNTRMLIGSKEALLKPQEQIAICVHPFYGYKDTAYDTRMTTFLEEYKNSILIFEDENNLLSEHATPAFVKNLQPRGARYFFPTKNNHPKPTIDGDWKNVEEIIKKIAPQELIFTGSLLSETMKYGFNRCVGIAYMKLKDLTPQARFDYSLCKEDRTPLNFRTLQDIVVSQ